MKTFFYKKLIPLAMITSLTATSMATVVEAAQPTETTNTEAAATADVPTVPADLEAAIANNAATVMENTEPASTTTPDGGASTPDVSTTVVTPAETLADYEVAADAKIEAAFDVLDSAANTKEFTLTLNVNNKKTTAVKAANISFVDASGNAAADIKVTAVKGDSKAKTVTITGEVKYGAAATATYNVKVGTSTSKNTVAFTRTQSWTDTKNSGSSIYYTGTNEYLNIPAALNLDNGTAQDVNGIMAIPNDTDKAGNDNVKKITMAVGVSIGPKAFAGWDNLSMIEIKAGNPTISADAFDGCTQGIAIVASGNITWQGDKPDNVFVYSASDIPGTMSIKASDELSASFAAKTVGYAGGVAELKRVAPVEGNAKIATDEELAAADTSKIKWAIKGNAKFAKVGTNGVPVQNATTGAYSYSAASLANVQNVKIGATKASGQLNSTVTVTVQVPVVGANKKTTYKDAYSATLYVNPVNVTGFKVTPKASVFEAVGDAATTHEYNLTLDEGASYTLPIKAADGANKALNYIVDGDNVTVVNGKVKAVAPGTATKITVVPVEEEGSVTPIEINVTVKDKTTGVNANTKSITVVPGGAPQEVTLSALPVSSKDLKVKLSGTSKFKVEYYDGSTWADLTATEATVTGGAAQIKVSLTANTDLKTITSADRKIKINVNGKDVIITATPAGTPENLKTLTEKNKPKKGEDDVKINIPVGGVASLGISANPAKADSGFSWTITDDNSAPVSNSDISIEGDVVKASKTGVYYAYATSNGLNENSQQVDSKIYVINVYDPGSSIVWDEEIDSTSTMPDYVIKGGYLMNKTNAATVSDKTVPAGQDVVIAVPDLTGIEAGNDAENIIWTISNPANAKLNVDEENDTMTINAGVAGTYTITGTTEFTKQKYTFKVMAVENFTDANKASVKVVADVPADNDGAVNVSKGDKVQLSAYGENGACAGKVSFVSSNKAVANVNAKGQITALAAGETTITVKFAGKANKNTTSNDVTVKIKVTANTAASALPAAKAPTSVAANGKFSVSVSSGSVAKWVYKAYDKDSDSWGSETELPAYDPSTKKASATAKVTAKSGTAAIGTAGKYLVYAVDSNDIPVSKEVEVNVYNVVAKTVSVVEPYDVSLKDWANAKIGITSGAVSATEKTVTLAIKATGTDANGKTVMADQDEIVWSSSNVNLATAEDNSNAAGNLPDGYAPYSFVTISLNNKGYTGKVTLTGTFKNSGKKVKITLNITGQDAPSNP